MPVTTAAVVSFLLSCCLWIVEPYKISTISVPNGWEGGGWGQKQICATGLANRFSLKIQPYQGTWQDDSSLNGIRIHCSDGTVLSSSEGEYGTWSDEVSCESGFLNSFSLRVSPSEPMKDNTAAENIKFKCTDGTELEGNGHAWGEYGAWSESCPRRGICGIQTRVPGMLTTDYFGLLNVKFFCCG